MPLSVPFQARPAWSPTAQPCSQIYTSTSSWHRQRELRIIGCPGTVMANGYAARTGRLDGPVRGALIDTSPVGVAVFDPGTGHPEPMNREAMRLVERLPISHGACLFSIYTAQ